MSAIFEDTPEDQALLAYAQRVIADPPTGTIPCMAVDEKGNISATTTTSGLAWKIPGRVGDSPIIGAGCCVDNEVGAAGSTGKGEENIKISGGHTIIEMMRQGSRPRMRAWRPWRAWHQLQKRQKEIGNIPHLFLRLKQRWSTRQRFAMAQRI